MKKLIRGDEELIKIKLVCPLCGAKRQNNEAHACIVNDIDKLQSFTKREPGLQRSIAMSKLNQKKLALFPKMVEALDIILDIIMDKHRRTRTNIIFAREVLKEAKALEEK